MDHQRNVLASFDSRTQANQAIQMLTDSRLSGLQMRVLPPPSAASAGGRVIVSLIVASDQAHRAEEILGRFGHVDLVDEHQLRTQHELQTQNWRSRSTDDFGWGEEPPRYRHEDERRSVAWRAERRRRRQTSWTDEMPSGSMIGGLLSAVAIGAAVWYGVRQLGGDQLRSDDRWRLRGARGYGVDRRQITDEPGSGRQRLHEWRERGAMEGVDNAAQAERMYDRTASARPDESAQRAATHREGAQASGLGTGDGTGGSAGGVVAGGAGAARSAGERVTH